MIRILNNKDKEMVMYYLEKHHIECTFLIGNVLEFGMDNDKAYRRCGDYYGYFENNSLKGVIPFYNLGSCIPHFETKNAIWDFASLIKERNVEYLLGMKRYIKPLYDEVKDYKITLEFSEDSYFINNNFKPFEIEGVKFIEPSGSNIDDTVNFLLEAREKGFGDHSARESALSTLKQRTQEEDFIFETIDDKIVAEACIQASTSKINQIGGVYTTEDERGKGYCKAVVSELCRRIVERGKLPTLMVTNSNTPAVKAYKSLGFEYYDDYNIVTFKCK